MLPKTFPLCSYVNGRFILFYSVRTNDIVSLLPNEVFIEFECISSFGFGVEDKLESFTIGELDIEALLDCKR